MRHLFIFCGISLISAHAMAQVPAGQNGAPPALPLDLERLLNPNSVKVPAFDITVANRPEPIEFSYAKPALEAAQWWSGITADKKGVGTSGISADQFSQSREAVQRFAKGHKDDAPLLLAWQVNGETWRVHLTPSEAVSKLYPPSIREWGVPKKLANSHKMWLVPMSDPNGVTPDMANPLIIWPPGNAMRWQIPYLLSRSSQRLFPARRDIDIQFNLLPPDINRPHGAEVPYVSWTLDGFQEAHLNGNTVYVPSYALNPLPALGAVINQQTPRSSGDPQAAEMQRDSVYFDFKTTFWSDHDFLRDSVGTAPARLSRILATLDARYLTDDFSQAKTNVPQWMQEGLQNIYSIETADKISNASRSAEWFPQMSPEVQRHWSNPIFKFPQYLEEVEDYARRGGIAATPVDEATVWAGSGYAKPSPMMIGRDTPKLEDLDSTSQMRFFFERFGDGAVTETLQRLGSGQSFDVALHETTGLTPAQFLAAWQETQK